MMFKLYNSETLAKETVTSLTGDRRLRVYTCGPTVYNYAHIGNFRTYVAEDLLRRALGHFGFQVTQVMNLTDVDDKTIKGAMEQGISLDAYTHPYIDAFFADLKTLSIQPVEFYPRATDYIPKMIEIIDSLVRKAIAYVGQDGSVYYDIDKFPTYGRLSHLPKEGMRCTSRASSDEYEKEHVCDFVLWKAYDPARDGAVFWESPWGRGRPGWHIECSAMAIALLGESIDIHVGGVDNRFPHHENEIAQSEAFSCKKFVAHWMHVEHLLVDGKKMSKSLGNFYTLGDLLNKGFTGKQIRYALLQAHYRSQLNFTLSSLEAAAASLDRIADLLYRLRHLPDRPDSGQVESILSLMRASFDAALSDDLNISSALAALFDMVHAVNLLCDSGHISKKEGERVEAALRVLDDVLAVIPFEEEAIPQDIQEALAKRELARTAKQWQEADKWRNYILAAGYLIEDTSSGPHVKKIISSR